jgi:hypothetical protein
MLARLQRKETTMKSLSIAIAALMLALGTGRTVRADEPTLSDTTAKPNSVAASEQAADKAEEINRGNAEAGEKKLDRTTGGGEVVNSGDDVKERGAYKNDLKGAKVAGDIPQEAKDRQGIHEENKEIKQDKKMALKKRHKAAKAKAPKPAAQPSATTSPAPVSDSK